MLGKNHRIMKSVGNSLLQSRETAGGLLSQKLDQYRNSNAVVVGIPPGGACVASVIANKLGLPLQAVACRQVKHPADSQKTIGSVSASAVFIHDCPHTLPQDYVRHQIALLRNVIRYENSMYYRCDNPISLLCRTVILVNDILESSDSLLSCVREIVNQRPQKVIVAVPVASAEAVRGIRPEVDDIIYLDVVPVIRSPKDHYANLPDVHPIKVKELLREAEHRRNQEFCEPVSGWQ